MDYGIICMLLEFPALLYLWLYGTKDKNGTKQFVFALVSFACLMALVEVLCSCAK